MINTCLLLFFIYFNYLGLFVSQSNCTTSNPSRTISGLQSNRKDVCLFLFRDDAFSDSLSQKADSEASSGPLLDDKASSKNDLQSPCEPSHDYNFGGVMGRSVADYTEFCLYLFHIFSSSGKMCLILSYFSLQLTYSSLKACL